MSMLNGWTLPARAWAVGAIWVLSALLPAPAAAAMAAEGDSAVYRLVNLYNGETLGQLREQVTGVAGGRVTVEVEADPPQVAEARTDVYDGNGNWLRHPLESHGRLVGYTFERAFPARAFPLEPGRSWSERMNATVAGKPHPRSVRVDAVVLGREKIRVPAGEFETIKIRRLIYPGDDTDFLTETQVLEYDWYAPAIGRTVRSETRSEFLNLYNGRDNKLVLGDWYALELVELRAAGSGRQSALKRARRLFADKS